VTTLDDPPRIGRESTDESLRSRLPADGLITGVDGRGRTTSRVEAGLVDDGEGLALVRGDLESALWDGLPRRSTCGSRRSPGSSRPRTAP
jgi:hypothetical protein